MLDIIPPDQEQLPAPFKRGPFNISQPPGTRCKQPCCIPISFSLIEVEADASNQCKNDDSGND
jgi:hypothetical protein